MRVLYFHQHFGTPAGATGTRSYEFARALIAAGHSVTVVCGAFTLSGLQLPEDPVRKWARGVVDGIDVIVLPLAYSNRDGLTKRTAAFVRFAWRSAGLALREHYDLLFASSTPLTAAVPGIAIKLARRREPFVFEVRDLWPELPRALGMTNPILLGCMSILEKFSYLASDACIGLSPGIADGIRRRARRGHPVAMIPNGCDLELFHPSAHAALQLAGIGASDFVCGFTGAHGRANGLDSVIDAAVELKRRGRINIKIVLIGDGNQKDRLVRRAVAARLDNVLFFPPMKKLQLAGVTASFNCGLMVLEDLPAFHYGTSPNKFFDYISAGIPVVCNYPGWLADLIVENRCGVTVPSGDAVQFAEVLMGLADNPARAAEYGANSRKLAERDFAREHLAARFVAFLSDQVSS